MTGTVFRFGHYEVDLERRELRKSGIRVGLQRKPFQVLELLLRHPGELVSRDALIDFLWPDSNVSFARGLNTAVNSLRKALGESPYAPHFVETRSGLGYRFSANVEEVSKTDSERGVGQDLHANEDCLKGRFFLDRMTEEDTYRAVAFFQSALVDDASSCPAHAGLAEAYCQLALFGISGWASLERQARVAAATALRRDPSSAQAHVSSGRVMIVFDWDWNGALEAVNRAMALDANSSSTHIVHSWILLITGRVEEALPLSYQAVLLDPLFLPANVQLGACLYAARDFKGAVDQCWKMLTLAPQFAPAQILMALAYEQLGMYEEAIVEFQNAGRCVGFETIANIGISHLSAIAGNLIDPEPAFLAQPTQTNRSASNSVFNYECALLCAARGETSQAILFIEDCLRCKDPVMLWVAADARFHALREMKRFQNLCRGFASGNRRGSRDIQRAGDYPLVE